MQIWKSKILSEYPEIDHGSLVKRPTEALFSKQVHGDTILKIDQLIDVSEKEADALMTDKLGIMIAIRTADCVPVMMYDPVKKVIAIVHAGWRGVAQEIVPKVIKNLVEVYKSKPEDIKVAMGPAICGACYDISTVEDDRIDQISKVVDDPSKVILESSLDLIEANKQQCLSTGVLLKNMETSAICTFEDKKWPSYRRDREKTLLFWSYIDIK